MAVASPNSANIAIFLEYPGPTMRHFLEKSKAFPMGRRSLRISLECGLRPGPNPRVKRSCPLELGCDNPWIPTLESILGPLPQ